MTVEEATGDNIEGALDSELSRISYTMDSGEAPKSEVNGDSNSPSDSSLGEV